MSRLHVAGGGGVRHDDSINPMQSSGMRSGPKLNGSSERLASARGCLTSQEPFAVGQAERLVIGARRPSGWPIVRR